MLNLKRVTVCSKSEETQETGDKESQTMTCIEGTTERNLMAVSPFLIPNAWYTSYKISQCSFSSCIQFVCYILTEHTWYVYIQQNTPTSHVCILSIEQTITLMLLMCT